jgi:hypothetical protein
MLSEKLLVKSISSPTFSHGIAINCKAMVEHIEKKRHE